MFQDDTPRTREAALLVARDEGRLTASELVSGATARLEAARGLLGDDLYWRTVCQANRTRFGLTFGCICGRHILYS